MNERTDKRQTLREVAVIAAGELLVLGLICGAYALLGKLDGKVLLGGAVGVVIAVLNYFLMAIGIWAAAARAEAGQPAKGKLLINLSTLGRFALMAALLLIGAKSGACNIIAMVIPLLAFRPLIFVGEFFRRKDG